MSIADSGRMVVKQLRSGEGRIMATFSGVDELLDRVVVFDLFTGSTVHAISILKGWAALPVLTEYGDFYFGVTASHEDGFVDPEVVVVGTGARWRAPIDERWIPIGVSQSRGVLLAVLREWPPEENYQLRETLIEVPLAILTTL